MTESCSSLKRAVPRKPDRLTDREGGARRSLCFDQAGFAVIVGVKTPTQIARNHIQPEETDYG
jgi:hypothetical protein